MIQVTFLCVFLACMILLETVGLNSLNVIHSVASLHYCPHKHDPRAVLSLEQGLTILLNIIIIIFTVARDRSMTPAAWEGQQRLSF